MKSCFFIGHREADERLLPILTATIERLITEEQVMFSMLEDMEALTA